MQRRKFKVGDKVEIKKENYESDGFHSKYFDKVGVVLLTKPGYTTHYVVKFPNCVGRTFAQRALRPAPPIYDMNSIKAEIERVQLEIDKLSIKQIGLRNKLMFMDKYSISSFKESEYQLFKAFSSVNGRQPSFDELYSLTRIYDKVNEVNK